MSCKACERLNKSRCDCCDGEITIVPTENYVVLPKRAYELIVKQAEKYRAEHNLIWNMPDL